MAKESAIVTLSPLKFIPGLAVIVEDAQDVIRAANYAACEARDTHGSALCGIPGWDTGVGTAIQGLNIVCDGPANFWQQRMDYLIRVGPNAITMRFLAQLLVTPGDQISIRLLIDGAVVATILNVGSGTNGNVNSQTFAAVAPGDHNVTVEINRNASGATSSLVWFGVGEDGISDPTTLPDPSG